MEKNIKTTLHTYEHSLPWESCLFLTSLLMSFLLLLEFVPDVLGAGGTGGGAAAAAAGGGAFLAVAVSLAGLFDFFPIALKTVEAIELSAKPKLPLES